jgi:putative phosphoribosyl transferase
MKFKDRTEAGQQLAQRIAAELLDDPLVLALPRGGVPVAYEVARALGAPLDLLCVRKLGAPFEPELAIGALAEGGTEVIDRELCRSLGVSDTTVEELRRREERELTRRVELYRQGRPPLDPSGRTVVIVDDGVATGATARAAVRAIRLRGARRVLLAAPVVAAQSAPLLAAEADQLIAVTIPSELRAIGAWYDHFEQVTDAEVRAILVRPLSASTELELTVDLPGATLHATLLAPAAPLGLVLVAHGSGSSRHSPRNRLVARRFGEERLATLLVDLLTDEEVDEDERSGALRFDIPRLGQRLVEATRWAESAPRTRGLPIAYFGASTGAAAALVAAAALSDRGPQAIRALVSRGGRPDLALSALPQVRCPVLLLVGSRDAAVLELNRLALQQLSPHAQLELIEGATHLFEEPGALERVATSAARFLRSHLSEESPLLPPVPPAPEAHAGQSKGQCS